MSLNLQDREDARTYVREIIDAAGFRENELVDAPQRGGSDQGFKLRTRLGEIDLDLRQNGAVLIDWTATRQEKLDLLFCSEIVPKGMYFIRAQDKEKAVDYLMRLWLVFFRREMNL